MAFRNKTRFLVRILIFITLGTIAIGFTDLVILKKQRDADPFWWSHNVFTTLAYWSSDSNVVDITTLKSQHASYMEEGIELPKNALSSPVFPSSFPEQITANNNKNYASVLSEIEPAAGEQVNDNMKTLELEKEDISDIFSRRNVEEVILSYGEVPEYEPAYSIKPEPVQKEPAEVKEIKLANIDKETFEIYTHAPIEVEEKYPTKIDEKDTHSYISPEGTGKIAIIIDDMGLSLRSKLVEVMPGPLTLSYLPYAKNLKERTRRADTNGHELMVHMPMEPLNGKLDAGPRVLMVSQSKEEILDTLDWGLSQFDGYVGINNHMGSRITADKEAMDHIMAELKARGLFFVDSRTIGSSVAAQSAREAGIPYAVRDIFLDHEVTPEFIRSALQKLENKAATRGYAIAIGHPHKETIVALKEWIPTLDEKGLSLVPVSELLQQPVPEGAQAKLD